MLTGTRISNPRIHNIMKAIRVRLPRRRTDSTLLPLEIVTCTIGQVGRPLQTVLVEYSSSEEGSMEGGYAVWMGQPVILRVVTGNLRVPLRGRLLSETNDVVRLRIADSWDVDIFKTMVVGIEHDMPVYVLN